MRPVIIIGTGLAGYTLARELRKLDTDIPLYIITADDGRFYSKPMLSNALSKGTQPEQLATADNARMAADLHATLWTETRVTAIDPVAHTLRARDETLAYSTLVLALGADPVRPPLAGDGAADVYAVNDLADYTRFRHALTGKKRVAIIGAGLIGCEFANDLQAAGFQVDVIGSGKMPLDRLIPEQAGRALEKALAGLGVSWHLGNTVQAVAKHDTGYRLTLADASVLEADIVLSAVGLRARTDLAQEAGLDVNRGIVVDRQLLTSQSDIYALGDCAEVAGLVLPFVMPLMSCARALAKTLAGVPTEVSYPAMPVLVKTPVHPVVVSPPPHSAQGQWEVEELGDGVRALFYSADHALLGMVLTGAATTEKNTWLKQLPAVLA
ncbi:MAG: FAD-dependent oxidoreductase [Gammaproteobacteria bacterium]|nr:FAD-dependent oxidoreductase [Gammaproteobacteria bacterium]